MNCMLLSCIFFFFKQKTAYEMRISDWSSDVCSSDLVQRPGPRDGVQPDRPREARPPVREDPHRRGRYGPDPGRARHRRVLVGAGGRRSDSARGGERKSVVLGKSVLVRVDLGGRRIIKKKKHDRSIHKNIARINKKKYIHK